MSHKLISLNDDLKKLRDEGYEIEIKDAHLLVHSVPYVNSKKEIVYGSLVSTLTLSGDRTVKPNTHVISFTGEHPCNKDGTVIRGIQHQSSNKTIAGLQIKHSFSNKPAGGYANYYEKVINYIRIIEAPAQAIDFSVDAQTSKKIEFKETKDIFNYSDTNSTRAEISSISAKLFNLKIAIIGLGGTGSYVLDFVAKTPVKDIHLFDGDDFLNHNAFRAPGATPKDKLTESNKKVDYLYDIYSNMHKNIIKHPYNITTSALEELSEMNFVFICIDKGEIKKSIIQKLIEKKIPFVDVGIGIISEDGSLMGSARVTTATEEKSDHIEKRISFSEDGNEEYSQNIQIAEINAIAAALAVIRWKKIFSFYNDQGKEYNVLYDISLNALINDETIT